MAQVLILSLTAVLSLAGTAFFCDLLLRLRLSNGMLDYPNVRSLHTVPKLRAGGVAIWAAVLPIWIGSLVCLGKLQAQLPLLVGLFLLIAVSWFDDRKYVPIAMRLAVQVVAVAIGVVFLLPDQAVFIDFVPLWWDRTLVAFGWLWFINLTNFMDGIDGLSGAETAHLTFGFFMVAFVALPPMSASIVLSSCLFGAALGFLWWNWPPSKIFLGDVGSIPLGYLLGYLLLLIAAGGHRGIALVLPLYYLADATITLVRRIARGDPFWTAHREHFYQKAALAAKQHEAALLPILVCNSVLLLTVLLALRDAPWALLAAPVAVGLLLWYWRL